MNEVPPARQSHGGSKAPAEGQRFGEGDLDFGEHYPEPAVLPPWVPVLIGVVLAVLAGLAVYTGLRYRTDTITRVVRPGRAPRASQAPPGEPEAGASLVFPGESGDNTPAAHPPVAGKARAVVTGTDGAIETTIRIWARRGMLLNVDPRDAVVYVNDVPVGQASQFSTQPYEFSQQGSYVVKLVGTGRRERSFIVTADEHAKNEIAKVNATLQK